MSSDSQPAGGRGGRLRALSPRQQLTGMLLLGAAGAGLVFLAMHQTWAHVHTPAPAPLPASDVTDSGQSIVPYADALAVAALATLAAVLATRGLARRVAGGLLAALGLALAASAVAGVTPAAALAATAGSLNPSTGSAGSTTSGISSGSGGGVPNVAGFHSYAVLTAGAWQALTMIGALAVVVAGVLVVWRAGLLPVMSARYDAPVGGSASRPAETPAQPAEEKCDSATMWESLSRGEDPTSATQRR
jgi:uncharacterized membrane protein (TIGR02234 family)